MGTQDIVASEDMLVETLNQQSEIVAFSEHASQVLGSDSRCKYALENVCR